jgi:DNA-3-methyladenine glycosylase I
LQEVSRCPWAGNDPDYCHYHDYEWGVPVHDDRKLLEMLILEGFQAGLSWITILKKRENFRKAFANWDVRKIAAFTSDDVNRLLDNTGFIRNRRKIESAINNARRFIEVQKEFGSFDRYIWQFTNYKTLFPKTPPTTLSEIPTHTPESDAMSRDLQKRGFNFVGTVICYSFMQAVGMVNDHVKGCFKFEQAGSDRRMSI